jgi:hypothetical protein
MSGSQGAGVRSTRRVPAWMTAYAVWAAVLTVAVLRCKGNHGGQTATESAVASTPTARVLPPPVEQAEALAEDAQTDIDQNAWPAAEAKFRELKVVGESLASVGVAETRRSAYGNALDSLGAAITRRSQADALTAGNRVSRVVAGIMADYPTKVPVNVTLMDVAARDALYAAQQGRWGDAAKATAELGRSYTAVQVHVRARDLALDRRVTAEIARLQRAVASRARNRATSLAQTLLEDVDRIEQTF